MKYMFLILLLSGCTDTDPASLKRIDKEKIQCETDCAPRLPVYTHNSFFGGNCECDTSKDKK